MACLVLALSCLPCADKDMPSKTDQGGYTLVKDVGTPDSDQNDNCSPFCLCACCPGFSINHPLVVSDFILEHNHLYFSSYLSPNAAGVSVSVWQPPREV